MRRSLAALVLLCVLVISGPSGAFINGPDGTASEGPVTSDATYAELVVDPVRPMEIRVPLGFGDLRRSDYEGYTQLYLEGANGYIQSPGAPVLPTWNQMLTVPVDSVIVGVSLVDVERYLFTTDARVVPAPEPIPIMFGAAPKPLYEGDAYSSDILFPDHEVETSITTGRSDDGDLVAHVFARVFPLRYNPVTGQMVLIERADLVVRFLPPTHDIWVGRDANETYDILVLCPEEFYNETLRYEAHREAMGWKVKVVSLDDVYDNSIFNVSGARDDPERVKYFLKQAIENWTIEHLLVIGDIDKFPIRKVRVEDVDGTSTPTDLYYGDVFKQGTTNLSDWNSDGDSYWGESRDGASNADSCDMDPDLHVGRFPVSTLAELEGMINKTISYDENITKEDAYDWFRNVTFVGSDTFGTSSGGVAEGEYALNAAAQYIPDLTISKFYEDLGTFNINNIRANINQGAGLMSFSDHGNNGGVVWTSGGSGPGLSSGTAAALTNGHMLPLSIQDACLTNNIDASDSLGENIVLNPNGGGIGSFGATRIGWGMWDQWHITRLSGYMGLHLTEAFSLGHTLPAEMLDSVRVLYLTNIGFPNYHDYKTLVEYIYYGDPVVQIGGPTIEAMPETTTMWVEPGDDVTYTIEVRNRGLFEEDVTLTVSGGDWGPVLNITGFHMEPNTTRDVTVSFEVASDALAFEQDSFVLSLDSNSTPIPVETEFFTYVIEVRSVDIYVNDTELDGVPGGNVTLDFAIVNDGNAQENATATLQGDIYGTEVNVSIDDINISAWSVFEGNFTIDIPDPSEAADYYLELIIDTEHNGTRSFVIKVKVEQVHGIAAHALDDTVVAVDLVAEWDVFIENLGNHRDEIELGFDAGTCAPPEAVPEMALPTVLYPYENGTGTMSLELPADVLAGTCTCSINVSSRTDPESFEVVELNAIIEKASSVDLFATEDRVLAKEGEVVTLGLFVKSGSNFEETVDLMVTAHPVMWDAPVLEMENVTVGAFSEVGLNLTLSVRSWTIVGEYEVVLFAEGEDSNDTLVITVVVEERHDLLAELDRTSETLRPGQTTAFVLTVNNTGNGDGMFLVRATTVPGSRVVAYVSAPVLSLQPFSGTVVDLTVLVPEGTTGGTYTVTVNVSSIEDPAVSHQLGLTIEVVIPPRTELDLRYDTLSTLFPGDEGEFEIRVLNLGNVVEDLTATYNGSLSWWNIEVTPNRTSVDPGKDFMAKVNFYVPADYTPGEYNITIVMESENGAWTVVHRVRVLARQVEPEPEPASSQVDPVPYMIIIILLVAALFFVIAMMAMKRSNGNGEEAERVDEGKAEGRTGKREAEEEEPADDEVTRLDLMMEDEDEQ